MRAMTVLVAAMAVRGSREALGRTDARKRDDDLRP